MSDRHIRLLLKEMGLSTRTQKNKQQLKDSNQPTKNRLVINDLNSDKPPNQKEFWHLNPLKII